MARATPTAWRRLPLPQLRVPLELSAEFNDTETEALIQGLVPRAMEDKWFIYFDQGWVLFHRSWTGAAIYGLRLETQSGNTRVIESWVNRDATQYKGTDVEYDRKLLRFLIDAFLLHRRAAFPVPVTAAGTAPGVFQHAMVGRAYPEVRTDDAVEPQDP
jgi:hypothetical protein